ncbi:hypothetical protein FPV67DRAFT_783384 [Lyophyllum atratum]|nr:hypothetical protein FPV67DRAFT_783384 [Lyophyllum atratum]
MNVERLNQNNELESSQRQSKFQLLPRSTVCIPLSFRSLRGEIIMQRVGIDYINHELTLLMQWNPPLQSPDLDPDDPRVCPSLTAPSIFYDKHLDGRLLLKRVQVIPLATDISRAVNVTSQSLIARKVPISSHRPRDSFPSQQFRSRYPSRVRIKDAQSLAEAYQETTGLYSSVVSSMFLLHPRANGWESVMIWGCTGPANAGELDAFSQNYGLMFIGGKRGEEKLQGYMDERTRETLRIVKRKYNGLAYWEVFAISKEAEDVLEGMEVAAWADSFPYQVCGTKGYAAPPNIHFNSADASMTGWGVSVSSLSNLPVANRTLSTIATELAQRGKVPTPEKELIPLRRSSRLRRPIATRKGNAKGSSANAGEAGEPPRNTGVSWPKVTVPARTITSTKTTASEMASSFLQRAWARSVEQNTTYTVFYCGNFERIGFRHRSSQTLFLSELIRVPECKNPGYGKIHMGLFISIVKDVMDRTELERQQDESPPFGGQKRRRGTGASAPNKRYKTRAMALKERSEAEERMRNQEIVKQNARGRPLMLLELRYGVYNSPAPASLLRTHSIQKDTYGPEEYFSIVFTSRIAGGATGVAHGATLRLLAADGEVRCVDVVVKLSFKSAQKERLRHEYTIYEHLATRGVKGIPFVYGLFEDVETDTMALVMSHVGTALKSLLPDDRSYGTTVSESAREAYLRVLGDIHEAGVRHRDIRPENLTLDGDCRREMRHITDLLNGHYRPPNEFPSLATTPEGETAPRPGSWVPPVYEDEEYEDEEDEDSISSGGVV